MTSTGQRKNENSSYDQNGSFVKRTESVEGFNNDKVMYGSHDP